MSPAVVVSHSSPSSSKDAPKAARRSESANAQPRARKARVVRRRRRGRPGMMESDDEIERETMSDASDSDEPSLMDSGSDSEAESKTESLGMHNGRHHTDTPSTTQSPPPGEVEAARALNGFASKPESDAVDPSQPPRSAPAFLSAGIVWSDMVTAEGINGAAPLPVIEFSELHEHAPAESPQVTKQDEAVISDDEKGKEIDMSNEHDTERPDCGGPASLRGASRPAGQSARLAYQQRLQTDPSFVPTVGEFWSHDDRLMQKDLRSLSGWWRGRWQGRGRGRGGFVGRGMRGRGRGGFSGGSGSIPNGDNDAAMLAEHSNRDESSWPSDDPVPPVEKPWTHDGFEEMKVREEQRRAVQKRAAKNKPPGSNNVNGRAVTPSRGAFALRGRGSFRGTSLPTPSRTSYIQRLRSQPDRPWFIMKPEPVWTKQFEGFLYSDASLKPKPGKPAGYRVKLPGKGSEIVRAPMPQKPSEDASELHSQPPSELAVPTDISARTIIVKLPKASARKEVSRAEEPVIQLEPITTVEDLPMEGHAPASTTESSVVKQLDDAEARPFEQPVADRSLETSTPALTRDNSSSEKSSADVSIIAAHAAQLPFENDKRPPEMPPVVSASMPPPIQTSFPPPLQPTPTYSPSPFAYPSLPPSIALDQQGFAYEVTSGRPVYLHPTPPPQVQIYNPRAIPFVPGHMHHPSLSGDFMHGPSTPPINGILDPSTGQQIFSLPRQSTRIEIRAPSDQGEGQMHMKRDRLPSNLRSTTVVELNGEAQQDDQQASSGHVPPMFAGYPSAPDYYRPGMMSAIAPQPAYQPSEGAASMSPGSEVPPQAQRSSMDPIMMAYPPFQQPYYYPEQYYSAYVGMPQQPGQYDPYNADPRQQPPMYY